MVIMEKTPKEFLKANMKWIALIFFCLFMLKTIGGCNRNMGVKIIEKQRITTIDSLIKKINILEEEKKELTFELKLQSQKAGEAQKRADVIQSVAEKIKSNTTTTVNVRGAQIDTLKRR